MPSRSGRKYVARVADLGQNELDCHSFGHAWQSGVPEPVYDSKTEQNVVIEVVTCLRCPKERTDVLDASTFKKVGRSHYTEPDRFRVLEPVPRGRSAYRRESYARARAKRNAASRAQRFRPV
jgi:hypothetical protein